MSFSEETDLATKYSRIFTNHGNSLVAAGVSVLMIGILVLFLCYIIGVFLLDKTLKDTARSKVTICICLAIVSIGFATCMTGIIADDPYSDMENKCYIDKQISCKYKSLVHARKAQRALTKKSSKLSGIQKISAGEDYNRSTHTILKDKHFLQSHKPEAPWINVKF